MKAFPAFFILILLTLSVSAEIVSITSSRGSRDVHSPISPVDVDNEATIIQQISITTQPGTTPQVFTPPTDSAVDQDTNGAVTFRRVHTLSSQTPPPISEFFFLTTNAPAAQPQTNGPTGAVTISSDEDFSPAVAIIVLLSFITLAFIFNQPSQLHSKLLLTVLVLFLTTMLSMKILSTSTLTTLAIYGDDGNEPPQLGLQTNIQNSFAVTWTGGGPVTFLSGTGAGQCSDGLDNDADGLVDCADPGCHSDGNANNGASCVPGDGLERDILEYDHTPVIDNQIDIYDIVNWVQYFEGDTTVLIHCIDSTCSNQVGTANCVGDADPSNDGLVTVADMITLQNTEIANSDSRTAGICFNPS